MSQKQHRVRLELRKPLFGIGINDATYPVSQVVDNRKQYCPIYLVWRSMLARCYSSTYQKDRTTYIGCSVHPDWLSFSNFRAWMLTQDYLNKELDKDILVIGNKVYSPDTCIFVPRELNMLVTVREGARGEYAQGVSWDKKARQFRARCNEFGISKYLGGFAKEEDASKTYRAFKASYIKQVALEQTNKQLKEALLHHASVYESDTKIT